MLAALLGAAVPQSSALSTPPRAAPALRGVSADGAAFDLAALRGNVVLVNFWATWCAPCRAEMPAIDTYFQAHGREGLRVIAISMDDAGKARSAREIGARFHFPIALANGVRLPGSLRPTQLPMTIVFDRTGALRYDSRRERPGLLDAAALARIVGPLLAEPVP